MSYDAIIVGARCAGAPTAMLLARAGYKVLVVDRSTFPSDTISTHVLHPQGVAALARWGLLDRLVATGCPPIHTYVFDFGPLAITGSPGTTEFPVAYCPRRTILDKLLVDAAREAGAEIREGFSVEDIVIEDGVVTGIRGHVKDGPTMTEKARIVIGADGRHSLIARAVEPETYNEKPQLLCPYYAYWSGLPMNGRFETYAGPNLGCAAVETHDGLTVVMAGWPFAEFEDRKHDLETNYLSVFEAAAPQFAARLRGARRESKIFGGVTPNFFRKPYGRGWALVGDAGYIKDPITAQGITDAFRDAELLTAALSAVFAGSQSFETALAAYQSARDMQAMPMYELTTMIATLEPPPPQMQQLLGAVHGNQDAMDGWCRMNAGVTSPVEFLSEANVARIFASAAAR
ncbi:MAG TPA: NAD(P)/FAD-dependent oxidoreductase [Kofleriaceae bacterium]|nr:NAD(P)/FAD-dependent oxidoreductase [Kofleriaceae bacterium]